MSDDNLPVSQAPVQSTLGQIAFEGYWGTLEWKAKWENASQPNKDIWEAAALAVREQVLQDCIHAASEAGKSPSDFSD